MQVQWKCKESVQWELDVAMFRWYTSQENVNLRRVEAAAGVDQWELAQDLVLVHVLVLLRGAVPQKGNRDLNK